MFEEQLSKIKDDRVRRMATESVSLIPSFFMELPSSSSGKYHPKYALGSGGLYRHVLATFKIAESLINLEQFHFNEIEKDCIFWAILVHDGWKQGELRDGNTVFEHPIIASETIRKNVKTNSPDEAYLMDLTMGCVESHMGQWNTDKYSTKKLPKPESETEKFLHLCDYLASRKFIEVNFES